MGGRGARKKEKPGVEIQTEIRGRTAVIEITGTVDLYEGYQLRDGIRDLLQAGSKNLVFVCRDVKYIDSTGLGIFVQARELAREAGGGVALVEPSPAFQKVLTTTQLDRLIPVFEDTEDAVASF
jgi:anti-anti-sigma factor